ncbi:hypothetical protein GKE82_02785 [Conexibacter sp. W3-3-2]|uniref:Uncharacterized protein n=1 Tax=Paraconexibacter algicola TaxID=2133960 RepID=A0A2T4UCS0_9ACTN|nr:MULTISPECIES: hypothetical protein [Solirubrobacterales]MTD43259.1 hypothetical protein [Conexibacter sp. W3-3-2]PTL55002.1 hypothetical protein C7Y72_20745 [Paraconexibacter algicola]
MSLLRRPASRVAAKRVVPWLIALDVGREAHSHVTSRLSPTERRQLFELVKRSGGRPSTLSARDRRQLQRLVDRLDLSGLAKHSVGAAITGRRHHGRGRRRR